MLIFDGRTAVQVRCMAGCEPTDIIAVLKSRGLWEGREQQDHTPKVRDEVSHDTREQQRLRVLARCIFDEAVPIEGTLAQHYFDSRDLWSVARMIDDVRFHLNCPRERSEQPAVVVAMRNYHSNAITAIQRIFLTRTGRKDGKGMMLGHAGGAGMKLQQLQDHKLHICEGLETGLAVLSMDYGPVWALGSTSLIKAFPVLNDIDELTIWADHDPINPRTGKRPGKEAADICAKRWGAAGKVGTIRSPKQEGWDEADVWSARCARP
jgi:hypothetical protein